MDKLNTNQHSLLAYRYLLEEVMEGGFIQLIHNGYGPYVLEGPFPFVIKKIWEFKDFGKFLFNVQHEYHMHKDEIFTELSEEEFMALYEQLEELDPKFNRCKKKLHAGRESAFISKELAQIICDIEEFSAWTHEELMYEPNHALLKAELEKLELNIRTS